MVRLLIANICALLALSTGTAGAADIRIGGQVRPRFEDHSPGIDGNRDTFTSMRVRMRLSAVLDENVAAFVEMQDVRLWGEEAGTLSDFRADNLDLHQGYFELRRIGGAPLTIRAGRQAVVLGDERLVGAVNWAQQGRAFDGIRLTLLSTGWLIDLLGTRLAESSSPTHTTNGYLMAAQGQFGQPDRAGLDLYAVYNRESRGADTDQLTFGARWAAEGGAYSHHLEGAYQTGDRGGVNVAAFLVSAGAGISDPGGRIGFSVWYDFLSGDGDPADDEANVFDTLFATNHKFYGAADVFTNIPQHTGGRGLQDLAARLTASPIPRLSLAAAAHAFFSAKRGGSDSRRFGHEVDLSMKLRLRRGATLKAGLSYFYAADALADAGRLRHDTRFGYLMTDVSF